MLLVTVDLVNGEYTPDEKRLLIDLMTEAAVQIEGELMRSHIIVKINESIPGNWAVGGVPVNGTYHDEILSGMTREADNNSAFQGLISKYAQSNEQGANS